jgi:hypothetical protein
MAGGRLFVERDDLGRADEGEVERIEIDDVFLTAAGAEADCLELAVDDGRGFEVRGLFLNECAYVIRRLLNATGKRSPVCNQVCDRAFDKVFGAKPCGLRLTAQAGALQFLAQFDCALACLCSVRAKVSQEEQQ